MMKKVIRIQLLQPPSSKLEFVKLIHACSDLGLKGSKDLCDQLYQLKPGQFTLREDGAEDYAAKFRNGLKGGGGQFQVSGDTESIRQFKLLELGLGEKEDYRNFIIEFLQFNFDKSDLMLKFVLEKLSKEDLQYVFQKSKQSFENYI
jgi:hypothetical protein